MTRSVILGALLFLSPPPEQFCSGLQGWPCNLCRLRQNEGAGRLVLILPGLCTPLPLTHAVCPLCFPSGGLSPPSFSLPTSLQRSAQFGVWAASFSLYFAHNKEHKNLSPVWCKQRRDDLLSALFCYYCLAHCSQAVAKVILIFLTIISHRFIWLYPCISISSSCWLWLPIKCFMSLVKILCINITFKQVDGTYL